MAEKTPNKQEKQENQKKKEKQEKPKVNQGNQSSNNKPKFNIYWIYGIIALAFIGLQFLETGNSAKEIDWNDFQENMLKAKEVEKLVVVNRELVEVFIKSESISNKKYSDYFDNDPSLIPVKGPHFYIVMPYDEFDYKREKAGNLMTGINVKFTARKDILAEVLSWLLPLLILVAVWIFIFRKMGGAGGGGPGGIFNIGKSRAKIFNQETSEIKIDFNDVAGLEEAKVEITEIVDFLKNPDKYTDLGGKIPKGALLVGPPGTGKTLLAKAVAGEAHVPFFSMSGSDFVEMFVGVGASRVRDLFQQAKQKAPCIIFIDEIDAIGRARGRNPNFGSNDERENTLNQLLTEMDGFDTNTGVIILAATNRADVLDSALLRAGRFDRQIHVELPDLNERKEIFKVHLKPLKIEENFDVGFMSKQTPGFSGADIANVCNESALIAARKDKKIVEKQDFLDAVDRIVGGLEKKNKIITVQEKRAIAYHEAGHAAVSWLLEHAHPLVKVTIIPRGRALGAAWYLPEERQLTTTEQILDEMCSTLGGRAAEEIKFDKISTGALNDLERVTKQAYAMVAYYGMGKELSNMSFYDSSGQNDYLFGKPYSDKTADLIDIEARNIITQEYQRAIKTLKENQKGWELLAERLLEREVIFGDDLEEIFGKKRGSVGDEKMVSINSKAEKVEKENVPKEKENLEEKNK